MRHFCANAPWKNCLQKLLIISPIFFIIIANKHKTSPNLNFCSIEIAHRATYVHIYNDFVCPITSTLNYNTVIYVHKVWSIQFLGRAALVGQPLQPCCLSCLPFKALKQKKQCNFPRQLWNSIHRAVIRQSSGSHQAVIRQSSGSHQAVIRQSSDSHPAVISQKRLFSILSSIRVLK